MIYILDIIKQFFIIWIKTFFWGVTKERFSNIVPNVLIFFLTGIFVFEAKIIEHRTFDYLLFQI
jgi:hypothetical protein